MITQIYKSSGEHSQQGLTLLLGSTTYLVSWQDTRDRERGLGPPHAAIIRVSKSVT